MLAVVHRRLSPAAAASAALGLAALLGGCASSTAPPAAQAATAGVRPGIEAIDTVVVLYAENRAFDTLYGLFPGANGIPGVNPSARGTVAPQRDRDGSVLPTLPPVWEGLAPRGRPPTVTQAQSAGLPNRMFRIDDPAGFGSSGIVVGPEVATRDLVHRFHINRLQIGDDGSNSGFAAWSDAGGLTMGYYDGSGSAMWKVAREFVLADNFFMGAFGGSYLNHHYLVCACVPVHATAGAPGSTAAPQIVAVDTDPATGRERLAPGPDMPASALAGPPRWLRFGGLERQADGSIRSVDTMQPAYQPSGVPPAPGGDPRYAEPVQPTVLPPQTQRTIGDALTERGISWAWYGGAWAKAGAGTPEARRMIYGGAEQFQPHHQPFNYYAAFDPATRAAARAEHLRDADGALLQDAAAGRLPAVTFYKPQGNLNQHPGYANVADGDLHLADVVRRLRESPQWPRMLIVVTYDENGGFFDHARVPRGDRWGPGTRIPTLIVSPFAKRGQVDHTPYDTASILRFIIRRWSLEPLPGLVERDRALREHGEPPMGDLTAALELDSGPAPSAAR